MVFNATFNNSTTLSPKILVKCIFQEKTKKRRKKCNYPVIMPTYMIYPVIMPTYMIYPVTMSTYMIYPVTMPTYMIYPVTMPTYMIYMLLKNC